MPTPTRMCKSTHKQYNRPMVLNCPCWAKSTLPSTWTNTLKRDYRQSWIAWLGPHACSCQCPDLSEETLSTGRLCQMSKFVFAWVWSFSSPSCSSYSSPFSIGSISVNKLHEGTVQLLPSSVWVVFLKQSTRWVHLQSITFSWSSEFKSTTGWKAMKVVNLPLWEKNTPNSLSQQSPEWKSVEVKALLVRVGCAKCQK